MDTALGNREHVEAYENRHPLGTKARLALDLLVYTGVRPSDVVRLGPQMEKDGFLVFTEYKGGNRNPKHHRLPILHPLRESIDATPIGHLVYLATVYGEPPTDKGFGAWFKKRCREAGLPDDLSAHGVRKYAAIRCAEAGATAHQLMALFGWLTLQQAQHYTAKANRARLEAEAAGLWGTKVFHLRARSSRLDNWREKPTKINSWFFRLASPTGFEPVLPP